VPGEKKVVLVADDEPDAIEYVRNVLEEEFQVIGVPDGVQALKEAKESHPALIILDIQMPAKDGFATFHELRQDQATKSIPVILLTAVTKRTGLRFSADAVEEYLGERPDAYVDKPIDPERLLKAARRLTAR
jgi:two-component system alkaline phosphatase synthesis response regulator PhoP